MKKIDVADWGSHISSRRIGAEIRNILNRLLLIESHVALDFADVETISNAFVDELIIKTVQMIGIKQFSETVTIKNISQNVKDQLTFAVNNQLNASNKLTRMTLL